MGLVRAKSIRPHALNSRGGADEQRVAVAALLAAVGDGECLIDGENLGIEDLLVVAEVVAASDLVAW